ncbi:MAG: hypothetical protein MUF51_08520 [Vicinamibacteria bacterium]|nr:hypothetical protein [Vicinamibacteria bacterium]
MSTSYEMQAQEMNLVARLGRPLGAAVQLPPLPLKDYAGTFLLMIVGLAGAVWTFVLWGDAGQRFAPPVIAVGVASALPIALSLFMLYRRATERAALTLYEHGLSLMRYGRRTLLLWEDVQSLQLAIKEKLNNGMHVGYMRKVNLAAGRTRLRFQHLSVAGRNDPVSDALMALVGRLGEEAEKRVAGGGSLQGSGWHLDAAGLHVGNAAPLPAVSLTEAMAIQNHVAIWQGEDVEASLRVSDSSANALVLLNIVQRKIAERETPARQVQGMGRLIFTRGAGRSVKWVVGVPAVFLMIAGLAAFALKAEAVVAFGLFGGGALLALLLFAMLRSRFDCHERGVVQRSLLGQKELAYLAIEKISYSVTRHYHNGVYTGSAVALKLTPEGNGRAVKLSAYAHGSVPEIDYLREHVAALVADRLYARLASESEVPWTGTTTLSRAGVHYRTRKLVGKGEPALASFKDDLRYSIEDGSVHLFVPGAKKSVLDLSCSAENFFPGLILFGRLAVEAERKDAAPAS